MDGDLQDPTLASELEEIQQRLRELRRQLDERKAVHIAAEAGEPDDSVETAPPA